MIRPITCVTFLLACGSGLYLYQTKHKVYVLDSQIEQVVRQTEQLREQTRVLHASWTLLDQPERLRQLAGQFLTLQPITPSQFASAADLDSRLPPVPPPPSEMPQGDPSPADPAPGGAALVASTPAPAQPLVETTAAPSPPTPIPAASAPPKPPRREPVIAAIPAAVHVAEHSAAHVGEHVVEQAIERTAEPARVQLASARIPSALPPPPHPQLAMVRPVRPDPRAAAQRAAPAALSHSLAANQPTRVLAAAIPRYPQAPVRATPVYGGSMLGMAHAAAPRRRRRCGSIGTVAEAGMPDKPDGPARPSASPPPDMGRVAPAYRAGAPRAGNAMPRMETVRITEPDLRRRAALERTRSRLLATAAGFSVLFLAVVLKLADATIIRPLQPHRPERKIAALVSEEKKDADAGAPSRRATITDRNGQILAISLPTVDLFADPRQVIDPASDAHKLKSVLPEVDEAVARARLSESTKQFVFLARRITPQQEVAVNNLGIPGLDFLPGEERHYTMGRVAAHVLGGVDIDEHGVAGVEKWFDKRLTSDQSALRLSLDVRVQAVVREELAAAMEEFKAVGAAGIVMDANTGEVLAMASLPDYETADLGHATEDQRFNRAASGAYEPGSTFKLQTVGMALDDSVIHLWDKFDTVDHIHIGRFTITDFEPEHHNMAVPEIIAVSSNIGASHIALAVGAERQRAWLRKLGFFARSPIQLPESAAPLVQPASVWKTATIMTVSFGNGIAVTPTQLIAGTAALVNGGVWHPATLVAAAPDAPLAGVRVEQPETSALMRKLMRIVVTQGTGKSAEIPGYLIGAKTGTSQKVGKGGYKLHANLSSMVAAFPMTAPRYLVYAMLDTPHADKTTFGFTTGGWTAGPAVKRIISRIGPMLGVMPFAPQELPGLEAQLYLPLAPARPSGVPVAPRDPLVANDARPKPTRPVLAVPATGVLPLGPEQDPGLHRSTELIGGRFIEASAREPLLAPR